MLLSTFEDQAVPDGDPAGHAGWDASVYETVTMWAGVSFREAAEHWYASRCSSQANGHSKGTAAAGGN